MTGKRTRRWELLDEMERVVPWSDLMALVLPYLPEGKRGRPPFAPETMLRVHFMRQWFNLSDPAMEEALHDVPLFREFACRRRVWIEATRRRWGSFEELNAWLAQRCRELWQELRHPEHEGFSIAEMLEHERAQLMPMTAPFDGYVEKPARVSRTCLVSVARNRYSVPCELAGQMVSTRLYPDRVKVVAGDHVVADHERLNDEGRTQYDWQHDIPLLQRKPGALRNGAPFADLPEPLQRLRLVLLREDGGDRVMAQVLAIVLSAGLDAVLVAVELALESAPPSGRVSVEHVRTCWQGCMPRPGRPTSSRHCRSARRRRPIPPATTPCVPSPRSMRRRSAMRDLIVELKELRLHAMAGAWADLVEQGSGAGVDFGALAASRPTDS